MIFSKNIEGILPYLKNIKGKKIGIKVHFGEKGNISYLKPEFIKKIYNEVKKNNPSSEINLIECNVLYKSDRSETKSHIKLAREHGFDMPIKILDKEQEIEINGKHFKKIKIGSIEDYDCLLVVSHVKGHIMTGFAGAMKNLGMGLASRAGKLALHSNSCPVVNQKKCVACGKCARECPVQAINLNEKAVIDCKKCIGCAHCINTCPEEAINPPWGSVSSESLQEKIVEYAYGIYNHKKCYFINALINITKDCDCMGKKMKKEAEDIGYLYSEDMLKIDEESYNLIEKQNLGLFKKMNPRTSPRHQIEYAKEGKWQG
jgi:uncharacterized Fe-S center protein